MLEEIKKNINKINSGIRSENLFDHGTLIAVSKKKEYELIKEAYHNGIRDFGENYAQELNEKAAKANEDGINIRWHFCLLYTSPSPRDGLLSRMPSSA